MQRSLPIIAQSWSIFSHRSRRRRVVYRKVDFPVVFAIEQPELHLHPTQQAMVENMLVSTVKAANQMDIDLRIVVETHSEAIINRLGELVFNKKIKESDVNLLIFNKNIEDGATSVSCASYDDQGYLQDWPYGFFIPQVYAD